jgi:hypothetical protein
VQWTVLADPVTLEFKSPWLLGRCSHRFPKSCAGANMIYSQAEMRVHFRHVPKVHNVLTSLLLPPSPPPPHPLFRPYPASSKILKHFPARGLRIALIMERVNTSEASVNFYEITRRSNPEDSRSRPRRRENVNPKTDS